MLIVFLLMIFVIMLLCGVMFRNSLIYQCRTKALDITHKEARTLILNNSDWRAAYDKYDSYGSYDQMLWDIRKWTYKQFYPTLKI